MNRCPSPPSPLRGVAVLATALLATPFVASPARAQTPVETAGISSEAAFGGRNFPADALRGRLRVVDPPVIRLDGREDRFSPGVRIRDARNLLVVSSTVTGQDLLVNYTRDAAGLVREVWVLSTDEARAPRDAATRPLLDFWPFASPPGARDDGRTPFADLPGYTQ